MTDDYRWPIFFIGIGAAMLFLFASSLFEHLKGQRDERAEERRDRREERREERRARRREERRRQAERPDNTEQQGESSHDEDARKPH